MRPHSDEYYASRRPTPDLGPYGNFRRFVWNPERRAFLDRTAKEWVTVGVFYLCFFGIVFSIFSLQLWITLELISSRNQPFLTHSSLIGEDAVGSRSFFHSSPEGLDNPGTGLIPHIIETSTSSPIIWISGAQKNGQPERYIKAIKDFLQNYSGDTTNYINCSGVELDTVVRTKPCYFDVTTLGNCSHAPFGYELPYQPCVYVKFNKRFNWYPDHFDRASRLPKTMPKSLHSIIRSSNEAKVWLSCDGAQNVDKEHIGTIIYLPSPGFSIEYFPYTGHSHYLSPVVALLFKNLTMNRLVTVECHIWANNIRNSYALNFQIVTFS